jgi:hypothetical protein
VHIPVTLTEYEPPPPVLEPTPSTAPSSKPAASRPADRPTPAPPPVSPPAAESPAPVLQTTTNPQAADRVVAQIQAAERDLSRVRFDQLSQGGKDHYQLARNYIRDALDALKINNYMWAAANAEKAAQLAQMLVK